MDPNLVVDRKVEEGPGIDELHE